MTGAVRQLPVITVVGESLVDVVRRPGDQVSVHPGGSPANVAVGLARLGGSVSFVTQYGDDEHGRLIRRHLDENGVVVFRGGIDGCVTSVAEASVDDGVARYSFAIRWALGPRPPRPAADSVCLHTGSIAAVLEPGASAVRAMIRQARKHMTISYDPNCRPALMGSPDEARRQIEALVAASDVVKVSDEDLTWLYPGRPYDDLARSWLATGPALVVVTRGAEGSYAVTATAEVVQPPYQVPVLDTIGAGDAFMAGLLDALRRRGLLGSAAAEQLRAIPPTTVGQLLDEAGLVAAITVSRPAADPPTAADVAAYRHTLR
ncbi:MAG: carbohydrate kinase family protein [Micromonosporaceae bacterium]